MTWAELRALWDERDNRYRERRGAALSILEADAVRLYRRTEVALLPQTDRTLAVAALNGWAPPMALH